MKILFGCSLLLSLTALADPTKPPPSWQAQPESAQLNAQAEVVQLQLIKRSEAGNVAIINGKQLRRGDQFNQYSVESIRADQVVLMLNGERKVLRLVNTAIKQYED
uniref:MSHA biogenesis protein MshK n=1 Tax=Rheinheimera sp. BAL341 TaxID=1708203 RepID=A0A486XIJ2_9GAMM